MSPTRTSKASNTSNTETLPVERFQDIEERRTDPADGLVYSLHELGWKYEGVYAEQELLKYFHEDCLQLNTSSEPDSLVPHNGGIIQKVKVYSMELKDRIVEIVGSIGDKIVIIKVSCYKMGSGAMGKVRQLSLTVGNTLKANTVFLQDGYVYIASTIEGQLMYLKAKVAEPIKSYALSSYEASKSRMDPAFQKFKPYYMKFHNGIADVIGTLHKRTVVIRVQFSDSYAKMRVWTLQSFDGARAMLEGYSSPLLSKAISFRQSVATRFDHIVVSIRDGAVHLKGMVGERILDFQTKVSGTVKGFMQYGKVRMVVEMVSDAYGKGRKALKVIQCSIENKFLYVVCQVKDRFVVVRIKVAEFAEHLQSRSLELYAATRTSLADACSGTKTTILNVAGATRAKAGAAGGNIRKLAANPDAQAAAAGAVALGASGGATGLFAGGAMGAVFAIPAAFFTFGLSVPVGIAVGASAGGVVGGSAGVVAGGVAGYKAHREKESIGKTISGAFAKAKARKDKAVDSASNLRSHLADRMKGHTLLEQGGTDASDDLKT